MTIPDQTHEPADVRKTMLAIYEKFGDLDAQAVDENFAHTDDIVAFGTDWDEKFVGWKQYRDVHATQFGALRKFKLDSRELEAHVVGDVAWVSDRPAYEIETRSGSSITGRLRVTAVFLWNHSQRRWLVVQWHVSSGLLERLHEY